MSDDELRAAIKLANVEKRWRERLKRELEEARRKENLNFGAASMWQQQYEHERKDTLELRAEVERLRGERDHYKERAERADLMRSREEGDDDGNE